VRVFFFAAGHRYKLIKAMLTSDDFRQFLITNFSGGVGGGTDSSGNTACIL
jgi:hypothetical protein